MKITLYTTGCPQCIELKKLLDRNNVEYNTETDVQRMISLGIQSAPQLGVMMDMHEAFVWLGK